ncbi:MAG: response regulator [Pseudomonadota bacterium]
MSLGKKVAFVSILLGIVFSVGTYAVLRVTILPAFGDIEIRSVEKDQMRVQSALAADLRALRVFNNEYASWTATYEFVHGLNPGFDSRELGGAGWATAEVHLVLLFDENYRLHYSWMGHSTDGRRLDPAEELPLDLSAAADASVLQTASGLLKTRSGLMQIVALPILDSGGRGPARGFVVTGQFVTDQRITEIARQVTADLTIYFQLDEHAPPEVQAARDQLEGTLEPYAFAIDEDSVRLYQLLTDFTGENIGVLEMTTARRVTEIGTTALRVAAAVIASTSAAFLLASLAFMQSQIVLPIKQLMAAMLRTRETGDFVAVDDTGRSDEIGALGREFNELTDKLAAVQAELEDARDEALAVSTAKSEFLARMSHEIRTPMNGVLGMTELLRSTPLSERQDRFVKIIYDSGATLLALINDILDFSKIEAGKLSMETVSVDLRQLVEQAAESFAEPANAKGIELITRVPTGAEARVLTDPTRLRQVIVNLLGNATKFTDSGEIMIRLDTRDDGDEVRVRVEVRDTGIGIRKESQASIFESFTQEDGTTTRVHGGTGLGLAISLQIVELIGGELKLESEPGAGSSFYFTLRLAKDTEQPPLADSGAGFVAGKRVLLVDDNATNLAILEELLSSWRAVVTTAGGAGAALPLLRQTFEGATKPFDLAILDWHMPDCDGLELTRKIRSAGEHSLPIIMLSSLASGLREADCRELGIAADVSKPVRQEELLDALRAALLQPARQPVERCRDPDSERRLAGRVLLAEDNPVNRTVAVAMLRKIGLDVDVAANGLEAVEQAQVTDYSVVLMDCQMPELDGFDATRCIRQWELESLRRPTPIVALTANALKGDREACLAAGMDDYLAKPFTGEQLYSTLLPWVAGDAADDDPRASRAAGSRA